MTLLLAIPALLAALWIWAEDRAEFEYGKDRK